MSAEKQESLSTNGEKSEAVIQGEAEEGMKQVGIDSGWVGLHMKVSP